MGLITTDGIILRTHYTGESDKICTLITPYRGKLRIIAKGARKIKNRFAGALEGGNRVRATIYMKKEDSIGYISQCDILDSWMALREDLDTTAGLFYFLSLVDELVPDGHSERELYELLVNVLKYAEHRENIFNLITFFDINLLRLIGIGPVFAKCVVCGTKITEQKVAFSNTKGGMMCSRCSDVNAKSGYISLGALKTLAMIGKKGLKEAESIRISRDFKEDISNFIYPYIVYHTGKEIKARRVLKQMDLI